MSQAAAKPAKRGKGIGASSFTPYLYILPSLILFSMFVFYPFAKTIYLSMTLTDQSGNAMKWIGLENFTSILSSKDFWFSLEITARYAVTVVAGSLIVGLICAIIANEEMYARGLARTVYAMPLAISSACIAVIATFVLNPTMGILNKMLGPDIRWLRDIKYALPSISIGGNMPSA